MTMSAFDPQAVSKHRATTHDVRRTADLLAELGDTTDGVESRERIGAALRRPGLWRAQAVTNIQQHLEQQLFTLIRRVEIGHAALVARLFRPIVRFTIDAVEIIEDLLTWPHGSQRYRFRAWRSKANASCFSRPPSTKISSCGTQRSASKRKEPPRPLQEWATRPSPAKAAIPSRSVPT